MVHLVSFRDEDALEHAGQMTDVELIMELNRRLTESIRHFHMQFQPGIDQLGDPFDNQLPYLRSIFGFMGILDHRVVVAESTTRPTSEERAQYIAEFSEILKQAAAEF